MEIRLFRPGALSGMNSHKLIKKFIHDRVEFLDALASLDFKLSVSESFTFFTASASTGLSELFFLEKMSIAPLKCRKTYILFSLSQRGNLAIC